MYDRQLLGIASPSSNDASGNNCVTFTPEDQYYDSNEWYELIKSYKDKVLKALIKKIEVRRPQSQDGTSSQGEAAIMGKGRRSPRLQLSRRKQGIKRGSC